MTNYKEQATDDDLKGTWIAANQRTCLVTWQQRKEVRFVMMESSGVTVRQVKVTDFLEAFRRLDYPADKAARVMLQAGAYVGLSDDAREELGRVIPIPKEKKVKRSMPDVPKLKTNYPPSAVPDPPPLSRRKAKEGTVTVKIHPPPKVQKVAQPAKQRKETAASFIMQEILRAERSDDAIFKAAAKKFGLDESKRNYIRIYRCKLRASGKLK